jgi:putative endonuclease
MYYAYVIYNKENDVFYPGFASDLKKRLARHNSPNNKGWTKRYQPWELLFAEEFEDKRDALKREKYFRSHAGRKKNSIFF